MARPQRADARRNHDLVLAAAKEVFGEHGVDAPLDEIARRAGVGNATMYRHFPTRRDLIIAVYSDEVTALCAEGDARSTAESPGDGLFGWLRAFRTHVAGKRDLAMALTDDAAGERSALFAEWHEAMMTTATALLDRAVRAGAVREDVPVRDLLTLVNGIALSGADEDRADRLLRIVRRGVENDGTA